MFYDFSFTIPANTSRVDPAELDIKLTHGIIHKVDIRFPGGCDGLVHLQIKEGLHQHWPTNPDGSFNGDHFPIAFNEYLEFTRKPYILTLVGWSPGTTYPHTLEVSFGILPSSVLQPEEPFIQAFKKLLKRLRL